MSGSADAEARAFPSSVALAAAYIWMKCWQAVFAARLRAELLMEEPPRWTAGRLAQAHRRPDRAPADRADLRPLALASRCPTSGPRLSTKT